MDSDIKSPQSLLEEYIFAYQAVRDSLHAYRDDEKRGELEVTEIAAVQSDLDALEKIDDPENDASIVLLSEALAKDVITLVGLDESLAKLTYVSYHKPKPSTQWAVDLNYVRSELQRQHAAYSTDAWYTETSQAYHRALDDREDYLSGADVSLERVENDIIEARFDLHCIGTHLCDLHKQNEGN